MDSCFSFTYIFEYFPIPVYLRAWELEGLDFYSITCYIVIDINCLVGFFYKFYLKEVIKSIKYFNNVKIMFLYEMWWNIIFSIQYSSVNKFFMDYVDSKSLMK